MSDEKKKGWDWNEIADEHAVDPIDELIDQLDNLELTKEKRLEYAQLPPDKWAKLSPDIKEACRLEDLLDELRNENDEKVFELYIKALSNKFKTRWIRIHEFYAEKKATGFDYGVKRFDSQYKSRRPGDDYNAKAKFILDNLQFDLKRFKACKKEIHGKIKYVPVGMTPDELRELGQNMKCIDLVLKSKEFIKYHSLIREIYIKGMSNIEYAEAHNINRGSVEHLKKQLFNDFAEFLARYDFAQEFVSELMDGDFIINPEMFKCEETKLKIFDLLEETKIMEKIDEELRKAEAES